MKLRELKKIVEHYCNNLYDGEDENVVIAIRRPWSTVCGHPFIEVKTAGSGFDWDSGKFFIYPEQELFTGTDTSADKVSKLAKEIENLQYQLRSSKQEIQRLKKKLKEYENEK